MSKKHVYDGRRWRVMVKFGRYRFGFGRMNGWSSFTWGLGFCCGNVVRRSVKRPAFVDICGASWNGLCGNDGLFLHRCARLTDHDGDHGCECGSNIPLVWESDTHCVHGFTWGQCCPKPYPVEEED